MAGAATEGNPGLREGDPVTLLPHDQLHQPFQPFGKDIGGQDDGQDNRARGGGNAQYQDNELGCRHHRNMRLPIEAFK